MCGAAVQVFSSVVQHVLWTIWTNFGSNFCTNILLYIQVGGFGSFPLIKAARRGGGRRPPPAWFDKHSIVPAVTSLNVFILHYC